MAEDIRDYLIDRFRSDGKILRLRAETLAAQAANPKTRSAKPAPGPDANVSRAMADACDEVVALSEALPQGASVEEIVTALQAMLPQLTARAGSAASQQSPPVRSVYVGACTRVQELIVAEQNAANGVTNAESSDDDEETDEDNA